MVLSFIIIIMIIHRHPLPV